MSAGDLFGYTSPPHGIDHRWRAIDLLILSASDIFLLRGTQTFRKGFQKVRDSDMGPFRIRGYKTFQLESMNVETSSQSETNACRSRRAQEARTDCHRHN